MNYYLLDQNNQQIGPYTDADLRTRLETKALSESDWVWAEGWPEWKPLGSIIVTPSGAGKNAEEIKTSESTAAPKDNEQLKDQATPDNSLAEPDERIVKFRVAPFVLALVCFFLPFVNFSCTLQPNLGYQLTGLQMVTGAEVQVIDKVQKIQSIPPAVFAILATIAALAFGASSARRLKIASGIAAIVGVISLFVIKSKIDGEIMREGQGLVAASYLFGFWAVMILLSIGTFIQFYLSRHLDSDDP